MKNFLFVLGLSVVSQASAAPMQYAVDASHSTVGFKIKHLVVSNVKGTFDKFSGEVTFEPGKLDTLKVTAEADVNSINTNEKKRDEHLKSPDFFDAQKHPNMKFVSKSVKDIKGKKAKLVGDLTIHGVTKLVTFDVEYGGAATDPWGNKKIGFTASGKINRKDFGLNWNKALEAGGVVVGDEVAIDLEIEANQK